MEYNIIGTATICVYVNNIKIRAVISIQKVTPAGIDSEFSI